MSASVSTYTTYSIYTSYATSSSEIPWNIPRGTGTLSVCTRTLTLGERVHINEIPVTSGIYMYSTMVSHSKALHN